MQPIRVCAALAAIAALSSGTAFAAEEDQKPLLATSRENWPTELTRRPLTLAGGMIELTVPVNLNISVGQDGTPVNINPSLYFGINDKWMIGVRHLSGICIGNSSDCDKHYNDISLDTVYSLGRGGGVDLAVGLSVNYAPIDPSAWSGEGRVIVRIGGGALALTLSPTINVGFNSRDTRTKWTTLAFNLGTYNLNSPIIMSENKEVLVVPGTLQLQFGPKIAVVAGSAIEGPLNPTTGSFGDFYQIPLMGGIVATPIPWVDLGASVTFPNLFGKTLSPPGTHKEDFRSLGLWAAIRI